MEPLKKKIFAYDNCEGDKGIIIANTMEEAKKLYKEKYPNRKIAESGEEYWNMGCYINEVAKLDGKSRIICTCPW